MPPAASGVLDVRVEPPAGRITIDGRAYVLHDGAALIDLGVGRHQVEAQQGSAAPVGAAVEIRAGETTPLVLDAR